MTTDTTTPVAESAALLAFKDRVRVQVKLFCAMDGYCERAVEISYRVLGLGTTPRMTTYTGAAHITGRFQSSVSAFDQESADQVTTAALARTLARSSELRNINVFGTAIAELSEAVTEPAPEELPDDDQVTALKAQILELAKKHVANNDVSRQKVNVRLAALGIEQIAGPKNWRFFIPFAGYPGAGAEYTVYETVTEEDAKVELAKLMDVDRKHGYVAPDRLRLPVPPIQAARLVGSTEA